MMIPTQTSDILKSKTMRALPNPVEYPSTDIANYHKAVDIFHQVFAIRPGDHVVMLTDPLLDSRVVQAVYGIARGRGASFTSYMGASTQLMAVPDEAKKLLERATFVVSTWFASIIDPFCMALRADKGQRWIKITFFRNLDLLHTPQARFPLDLLGEIVRATRRLYPDSGNFDLHLSDERGTDFTVNFTDRMGKNLLGSNRWRGNNVANEDGCYVHYIPTHGPNLYDCYALEGCDGPAPVNGIVYPQWAIGFKEPFKEKIGVEFKDNHVIAVYGKGMEADVLRDLLVGGVLEELGCGHNPKAPRFDVYPAGPNSPGGLHFGVNGKQPSDYLRQVMPNWEEPHVHMDLITFDTTAVAGGNTIIDKGFLNSLRDPLVVSAAQGYGDPKELLEAFPT